MTLSIDTLIAELLAPEHADDEIDSVFVDAIIARIDQKIAKQVDQVLHTPEVQRIESAWRGLKFVVDRTEFRENIKCEVLNCSKDDLMADLEDAPEIPKSGLYKIVYTAEYGSFGGKPFAAVFSNYELGPGPQDIALLQRTAAVAAMAHAPFFAAAGPAFFGQKSFLSLPNLKDIDALFEGPQYTKWRAFRDSDDSRYVGLVCPKFLLRLPYGRATTPVKRFNFEEDVAGSHEHYLWGNSTYAFATRIADSFARYRWCPNIIGPQAGGTVEDLPLHHYPTMGGEQAKVPTEVMLTERREYELSEQGFIGFTYRKDTDNAAFFSANSVQKPKTFGQAPDAKEAEINYKLGTQLPYMFVACRIAHYLKVIQRELIGTGKDRVELEASLNEWIRQYVADMDAASAQIRGKRPLRQAQIKVSEVANDAGWYKIDLKVRPHFKYMGAFFTLSLAGKIDKDLKTP